MLQTILRAPRTAEDIAQGVRLARMQKRDISPTDVARVLDAAKVKYVLVGAHAANGYIGRPRATVDVDVIVEFPKKAAAAVTKAFTQLTVEDTPVVTRFKRPDGEEAIDLMKPIGSPLWKKLLSIATVVTVDQFPLRIPPLEGVLAAKFAAMSSPHRRQGDKLIDAGDFVHIVEANASIDLKSLAELGELVYAGGGAFVTNLVADARAGRRIEF